MEVSIELWSNHSIPLFLRALETVEMPFPNWIDAPVQSKADIPHKQKTPGEWPTQNKRKLLKCRLMN
jgi:hypothetical protein